MEKVTTVNQLQTSVTRIAGNISTALNTVAESLEEMENLKADESDLKLYCKTIRSTAKGIEFLDGNGDTIGETVLMRSYVSSSDAPDEKSFWFYIEDDEEEILTGDNISIVASNLNPADSSYWFYIEEI